MSELPPPPEDAGEIERPEGPRIYAASLSDYNAGILHGVWLDATDEIEDLQAGIQTMLDASPTTARYGDVAEEWAIHDYEGWGGLRLAEYESLEHLSVLARGIAGHGPAFAAWVDACEPEDDEFGGFAEAYLGHHQSTEAYGEELLEEMGFDAEYIEAIPESLRLYVHVDVAAWVRDMEMAGEIITIEGDGGVYIFNAMI